MASKIDLPRRIRHRWARTRRAARRLDQPAYSITPEQARTAGAASTDLGRIFLELSDRPVFKWSHYLHAYEAEFSAFRGHPIRMLEIGVYKGGSLQVWRDYFGPDATIFGIDIDPTCAEIDNDDGITVRIGSQDDPAFLTRVVDEMGGVDIILDDGSHVARHQRTSFETLFPLLSEGGVYAVEDLHTSYWSDYGGRYGRGRGFIELAKNLIDDMHGWYHVKRSHHAKIDAKLTIPKIVIYDSIAFIHKAKKAPPTNFFTGP